MADINELTNLDVIPLSGLTVQDIKDYINKLSLEAGVMSTADIRSYIETIASSAGVQTQEELRNLIEQLAIEANVIPRNELTAIITAEVLQEINNLNDNKDYINEIRDDILKDLDIVEAKLVVSNQAIQTNSSAVHQVESNLEYQYQKLTNSIELIETSVQNIERSEELLNLIQLERENRILLDSTLNTKINTETQNLNLALETKVSKTDLTTKMAITTTSMNENIDLKFGSVVAEVNTIQSDLQNQRTKLNTLLLGTVEFQEKLNILAELSTEENLDVLTSLISKVDGFEASIIQANYLVDTLSTKVQGTEGEVLGSIQAARDLVFEEKTTRDIAVAGVNQDLNDLRLNIEGTVSTLRREVSDFEVGINKDVLVFSDLITDMNRTMSIEYQKVFDGIDQESRLRENNNKVLDLKITNEVANLYDRLSELDNSDEIKALEELIKTQGSRLQDLTTLSVSNKAEVITNINNIRQEIANTNINNISRFDTEQNTRITEHNIMDLKLTNEISTRISEVQLLNDSFVELKENILAEIVEGSNFDEAEKITLISSIESYEVQILQNYTEILALRNTIQNIEIDVTAELALINDTMDDKETLVRLDLTNEINTRTTDVLNLTTSTNALQNTVNTMIGASNIQLDNLETLSARMETYNNAIMALNVSTINDIQNITNALDVRVYNLELQNGVLLGNLDSEIDIREGQILALNTRVDNLNASVSSQVGSLHTSIANETAARLQDKVQLELQIQAQIQAFELVHTQQLNTIDDAIVVMDLRIDVIEASMSGTTDLLTTSVTEIRNDLTQEVDARLAQDALIIAELTQEVQDRLTADADTVALINIEKARLDTILAGTDIDLDSFQEIITFINDLKTNKELALDAVLNSISTLRSDYENALAQEVQDRIDADDTLDAKILTEAGLRADADTIIDNKVILEINNRIAEITRIDNLIAAKELEIQGTIDTVTTNINNAQQEIVRVESEYLAADDIIRTSMVTNLATIRDELGTVETNLIAADNAIKATAVILNATVIDNYNVLDAKILANANNFLAFLDGVPAEEQNLLNVYTQIAATAQASQTALDTVNDQLTARIDTNVLDISQEVQDRIQGLADLSQALDTEIQTRILEHTAITASIQAEIDARLIAEGILTQDLLTEINTRTTEVALLSTNLSTETSTRVQDDILLNTRVDNEVLDRTSEDANINTRIDDLIVSTDNSKLEIQNLVDAETLLREAKILELRTKIDTEIDRAVSTDARIDAIAQANKIALDSILSNSTEAMNSFSELSDIIDQNRANTLSYISTITNTVQDLDTSLNARITIEENTRTAQNLELSGIINTEILDRSSAFSTATQGIDNAVNISAANDESTRIRIDQEVNDRTLITASTLSKIDTEAASRLAQDTFLGSKIDLESTTRDAQKLTFQGLITNLGVNNSSLVNALGDEINNRVISEQAITDRIDQVQNIVEGIFNGVDDEYQTYADIIELIKSIDVTADNTIANFAASVTASLNTLTANLSSEVGTRLSQDAILNALITSETITRAQDIALLTDTLQIEIANRLTAVQDLGTATNATIGTLQSSLNNSVTTLNVLINDLQNEDQSIKDSIILEVAALSTVDTSLQNNINTLEAQVNAYQSSNDLLLTQETANRVLDVQTLTQNLDTEITDRQLQVTTNSNNITNEVNNRISGDTAIGNQIVRETAERALEIGIVDSKLDRIRVELDVADDGINARIDTVIRNTEAILAGTEINLAEFQDIVTIINDIDRENDVIACVQNTVATTVADLTLMVNTRTDTWADNLNNLETSLMDLVNLNKLNTDSTRLQLETDLGNMIAQNTANIVLEVQTLDDRIVSETANRQDSLNAIRIILENSINNEVQERIANILSLTQALNAEIQNRTNAISTLQFSLENDLNLEVQNRINDVDTVRNDLNAEEILRVAGDNLLQDLINTINLDLAGNKTSIENALDDEIALREAADGTMVYDNSLRDINGDYLTNTTDAINAMARSLDVLGINITAEIDAMIQDGRIVIPEQINESDFFDRIVLEINTLADAKVLVEQTRALTAEYALDNKFIDITSILDSRVDSNDVDILRLANDIIDAQSAVTTLVQNEETRAINEETLIRAEITVNENSRDLEIGTINSNIASNDVDIDAVEADIVTINSRIDTLDIDVTDEIDAKVLVETNRALAAEGVLETNLGNEVTLRASEDSLIRDQIAAIIAVDDIQTLDIASVTSRVDGILADTSLELDSIRELIDYVNANDTSITATITSINEAIGLSVDSEYIANVANEYTGLATSIRNSIDLLDAALKVESDTTDAELLTITQNLTTEVQARIAADSTLSTTISNLSSTLNGLILDNTTAINTNAAQIDTNQLLVNQEIVDLKAADIAINAEISTSQIAAGLETDGTYIADITTNYIDNAVSLKDACKRLDVIIKGLEDNIGDLNTLETTNKDDLVQAINEVYNNRVNLTAENEDAFDDAFLIAAGVTIA